MHSILGWEVHRREDSTTGVFRSVMQRFQQFLTFKFKRSPVRNLCDLLFFCGELHVSTL